VEPGRAHNHGVADQWAGSIRLGRHARHPVHAWGGRRVVSRPKRADWKKSTFTTGLCRVSSPPDAWWPTALKGLSGLVDSRRFLSNGHLCSPGSSWLWLILQPAIGCFSSAWLSRPPFALLVLGSWTPIRFNQCFAEGSTALQSQTGTSPARWLATLRPLASVGCAF